MKGGLTRHNILLHLHECPWIFRVLGFRVDMVCFSNIVTSKEWVTIKTCPHVKLLFIQSNSISQNKSWVFDLDLSIGSSRNINQCALYYPLIWVVNIHSYWHDWLDLHIELNASGILKWSPHVVSFIKINNFLWTGDNS